MQRKKDRLAHSKAHDNAFPFISNFNRSNINTPIIASTNTSVAQKIKKPDSHSESGCIPG